MPFFELLLILLITLGYSVAVVFSKISLNQMRPERFGMIYIMGAVVTIFAQFAVFHALGKANIAIGGSIWILLLAAVFGAFAYFFAYVGLKNSHAGVSSTIFNLQGPMIVFIGALIFQLYPGNFVMIGILTAITGLFVMGFGRDVLGKMKFTVPFLALCLSPLFWALEWVVFETVSSPAPIFLTLILYLCIFLMLAGFNLAIRHPVISSLRARMLAFVGGFFSGIANVSYGIFITSYGSTLTGIITLISVPVSLLLVVVFLKESYTRKELAGIFLVGLGLVFSTLL